MKIKIIKKKLNTMLNNLVYEITQVDVLESNDRYYFLAQHNLNNTNILVTLTAPNGDIMNGADMFTVTSNNVVCELPEKSFVGKYILTIYYSTDSTAQLTKKKLFEQGTISPDRIDDYSDYRLAIGKSGMPTQNITIDDFKNGLADSGSLPYLSDNPSNWNFTTPELMAAQQKLNVYSKGVVDSMYDGTYPITGVIDSVSSFSKNTSTISGTVTFNNVITIGGVSCYFKIPLTSTEAQGEILVGTFTIDMLPHFNASSSFSPYAQALVFNSSNVLLGSAGCRIVSTYSNGTFNCMLYLNGYGTSGTARTAHLSIDFPIYVTSTNN